MINGVQIIVEKYLISHNSPRTLKQYAQNAASYLIGLEDLLSSKLKFKVELFSCIQKQYLKCVPKENCYKSAGRLIVGPRTYEAILDNVHIKEAS